MTLARKESVLRSRPRIRYSNTTPRVTVSVIVTSLEEIRRGQIYRHHEEFFQAPYLDYVVRFVAAVKKTHETIRVSSFGIRSFDTTPGRCLAAACYIVALDIDHAEKLQRVKRNLRC